MCLAPIQTSKLQEIVCAASHRLLSPLFRKFHMKETGEPSFKHLSQRRLDSLTPEAVCVGPTLGEVYRAEVRLEVHREKLEGDFSLKFALLIP